MKTSTPLALGSLWWIQWRLRSARARREAFVECLAQGPDEGQAVPKLRAWLAMGLGGKDDREKGDWVETQLRPALSQGMERGLDGGMLAAALAAGLPANLRDPERWFDTPLTAAVRAGAVPLFAPLIHAGADPELVDCTGGTPLCMVLEDILQAERGERREAWAALEELVRAGAAIDGIGRKEEGARGYAPVRDVTALTMAVSRGDREAILRLLALGADIDARDGRGRGVFHHIPLADTAYRQWLGRWELIELLQERGASLDMMDHEGTTPLAQAIWGGDHELALLLVERGARMDGHDDRYNKTHPSQGTCFRPGATVLHHLVSTPWVTSDSRKFLDILQARHPDCWQWINALGETPEQMLRRAMTGGEAVEPFWLACAEQRRLEGNTSQPLTGRSRGPRL